MEALSCASLSYFTKIMKIGYARVSTLEQNLNLQMDALQKEGCEKIITDEISGSIADRPGLLKLKELLRPGDILVVWRLDRLGRSLRHLVEWVNTLNEQGIAFKSIHEIIDTGSSTGKLTFHQLQREGWKILKTDVSRWSPYLTEHLKRFGDYVVNLSPIASIPDEIRLVALL